MDHFSLWSLLRHYVAPDKIVRMIKIMYEGFKAGVIHEGTTTQGFEVKTGIKQGCLFSPLLFLVALDWVTQESFGSKMTEIQRTLTRQLEDPEFADDICLLSHKIRHRRQKINTLRQNAERVGLRINVKKTRK